MHITDEKLKTILEKSGMVSSTVFDAAREESKRSGQTITDILIGSGAIPEDYVAELLSGYYKTPLINLKKVSIPIETLEQLPESYAKSKGAVIFEYDKEKGTAKLAMTDPLDYGTIEYVRAKLGAWAEPYLTTTSSLKYGLKQYKKKMETTFSQLIEENLEKSKMISGESDLAKIAGSVPIIAILDGIIENAVAMGASDIHFEPLEKSVLVRYRVDGVMQEILNLPKLIAPILVARVKVLANLLIDEHKIPQDGRFRFELEDNSVDLRINVMPVFHGEKVEMRILKGTNRPFSLDELGISPNSSKIIEEEIKKPHGMILVTGPTGHGKTTTLYAVLQMLNTPKVNITTIEDPIEYEMSHVNQTQVNIKAGITFANGLRALLRQNPDIIMIGEIRDNETVDISIHAALTGHLVLSSLHTNDAPSAIPRFVDMGAPPFLLSSTLNVVIAQRLVRKICTSCIESYPIPPEIEKLLKAQIDIVRDTHITIENVPERLFRGKGCKVCGNSGFHGQIGIFEVLRISDSIRQLILSSSPVGEIRKKAIEEGMETMFADGLQKVERGITTVDEVLRVIRE
jgi:type IV pilus assembly protein PilB